MRSWVGIAWLFLYSVSCFADLSASQTRLPREDWRHAAERYYFNLRREGVLPSPQSQLQDESAQRAAVPLAKLVFSRLPEWGSAVQITQAFNWIRDIRFLFLPEMAKFPRRISWLYPDDGCFARAQIAVEKLGNNDYSRPRKLFIFGNLTVKTPNAPGGTVSWWYHVVPVIGFQGRPLIFDPAIQTAEPIELKDWILSMTSNPETVSVSLCHPETYAPASSCARGDSTAQDSAIRDEQRYLREEWERMQTLGRNPQQVLGDLPPWRQR